ncbi:LAME_0H08658g1_1 [Lachancea meyersii CBS 8951]|uniref:Pre-mRNA-splicing factor CWC21 n=1 Tax=Lachancea meyersii CBS 8951 TaxID=1266667 RepID=A0A1G4KF84_9SACH|nr:LAME_0H08658g1_1 [Lachancea meyersii CBS 8951]
MSFNGIGLKSAKGSSTSGHVQQSLASNKDRKNAKNYLSRVEKSQDRSKDVKTRQKRKDISILEHLSRREIEVRVSEYRDKLEEDDTMDDAAIDAKCQEYRLKAVEDWKKEREDEKLRNAYSSRKKRAARDNEGAESERS